MKYSTEGLLISVGFPSYRNREWAGGLVLPGSPATHVGPPPVLFSSLAFLLPYDGTNGASITNANRPTHSVGVRKWRLQLCALAVSHYTELKILKPVVCRHTLRNLVRCRCEAELDRKAAYELFLSLYPLRLEECIVMLFPCSGPIAS